MIFLIGEKTTFFNYHGWNTLCTVEINKVWESEPCYLISWSKNDIITARRLNGREIYFSVTEWTNVKW